jgi:hypothetical protein
MDDILLKRQRIGAASMLKVSLRDARGQLRIAALERHESDHCSLYTPS